MAVFCSTHNGTAHKKGFSIVFTDIIQLKAAKEADVLNN